MPNQFQYAQFDQIDKQSIDASGWPSLFNALTESRFYHHPDWFLAIDKHLLTQPLTMSVVEKESTALALFVWNGRFNKRRLASPKHDHLSLGDALIHKSLSVSDQAKAIEHALSACSNSMWDCQMHNVPARSTFLSTVQTQASWQCTQARTSAWFDLTDDKPSPGGKLKRNLKRLHGKLDQQGTVSMQWLDNPVDLPEAFAKFTTLEASGWKAQNGKSTAIAHNPELLGFYRHLLSPHYPGLKPIITLLMLDEHCIAAQFALRTGKTLNLLKIAYDESYANVSPGSLLLQKVIAEATGQGLETVSLVTSPAWAERWHPQTEPVWHATRYANNEGGHTLRAMDHLKRSARASLRPSA